jgi:hypothetical protein
MSGYSEDLRQRIVSSVEGGMSKAPRPSVKSAAFDLSQVLRGNF